jgi:hypothetical protein
MESVACHQISPEAGGTDALGNELRHLFLGDFGRTATKALHSENFNFDNIPKNNADRETKDAGDEAKANANQ